MLQVLIINEGRKFQRPFRAVSIRLLQTLQDLLSGLSYEFPFHVSIISDNDVEICVWQIGNNP